MYEDEDKDDGKDDRDREALKEAGKKLVKAKAQEARSSGLGVKARKQAWKERKGRLHGHKPA